MKGLSVLKLTRGYVFDTKYLMQIENLYNPQTEYFEEEDFDSFIAYLKEFPKLKYIHGVEEMSWGQRIVRFYDPDFHIIEVGEPMDAVIKRMFKSGMTVEQVSEKSQYPIEYVKRFAK